MISSIQAHRPLDGLTTFGTRSEADHYAEAGSLDELEAHLAEANANGLPVHFLGAGANTIAMSRVPGMTIRITIKGVEMSAAPNGDVLVKCGAGEVFDDIVARTLKAGIGGLENLSAIPGTVGGAVVMNAGAYGSETKEILESVRVMTMEGEEKVLSLPELELGYRTSCIPANHYIVLEARYRLKPGDKDEIKAYMDDLAGRRKSRQPLEFPSAGSTFKRPAGNFAGKLIEEAGLAGYRVGGAEVSGKHCGFVINRDHATASDIMTLCQDVKRRVKEHSGVELEMEVKTLGRF